jgi:glycerol-3-phosphate dehydrogenase (NAD+)
VTYVSIKKETIWIFSVKDADMLVFVTPHQFVEGICKKLVGKLRPGAEAIALTKGMEVKTEGPCMISKLIADTLGTDLRVKKVPVAF